MTSEEAYKIIRGYIERSTLPTYSEHPVGRLEALKALEELREEIEYLEDAYDNLCNL